MPNAWDSGKNTGGGGGSGTVTDLTVATANGISGTVANSTTTPEITLLLGNITPSNVLISGQTASRVAIFDGSKNVTAADTGTYPTLTEFACVKGVSSAIQTQLDAKRYNFSATVPVYSAGATTQTMTVGTPLYYAIPVLQDGIINSIEIRIGAFTSNSDFELGLCGYTASGNVSKLSSGTVTVTSTGFFSATLASPVSVLKSDLRVIVSALQKSGICTPYMQTSVSAATTELAFKGATLQNSLPATESTRASINYVMYMQPR